MKLKNKSVSLVGYGASNREMCDYLLSRGICPTVRNKELISLPTGVRLITEKYLEATEDIVFRSPVIRPDRIVTQGQITTEVNYALEETKGFKIGITGSDGKTTTSTLIYEILRADGKSATLCGNIGTPCISLAPVSKEDTYTVCELSSFQLMDMTASLSVSALTNISENHLDWHTDMNEYINAKRRIFKGSSFSVLNLDCPYTEGLKIKPSALFSLDRIEPSRAEVCAYLENDFIVCNGTRVIKADQLGIKGRFNLQNALCAVASLWQVASRDAIEDALAKFTGVSGRMENIGSVGGVTFISSSIDSTPSRTVATLSAIDKHKCVLILGGYDKGTSYEPLREATKGIKYAVLCGANIDKIEKAIKDSTDIRRASDLESAVNMAYEVAQSGDIVLLSPASASFDAFENYKQREQKFKEIVRGLKWRK